METKSLQTTNNKKAFIFSTALLLLYVASIMVLCLARFSNSNIGLNLSDYFLGIRLDRIAHFLMFLPFPFVGLIFLKYNTLPKLCKKFRYVTIVVIGVAFAAIAECSQGLFTTYRDSDPLDFCANITGILTGCVTLFFTEKHVYRILNKIFRI